MPKRISRKSRRRSHRRSQRRSKPASSKSNLKNIAAGVSGLAALGGGGYLANQYKEEIKKAAGDIQERIKQIYNDVISGKLNPADAAAQVNQLENQHEAVQTAANHVEAAEDDLQNVEKLVDKASTEQPIKRYNIRTNPSKNVPLNVSSTSVRSYDSK